MSDRKKKNQHGDTKIENMKSVYKLSPNISGIYKS